MQWIVISYIAAIVLATLTYRYVEKPFLSLRDRLIKVQGPEARCYNWRREEISPGSSVILKVGEGTGHISRSSL